MKLNYRILGILPTILLYKKNSLLFTIRKLIRNDTYQYTNTVDFFNSRELRVYNLPVRYTKKIFGNLL